MLLLRLILACLLASNNQAPAFSQQKTTTVQRDSAALTLLGSIVNSMGGASISSSNGIVATGNLASTSGGHSGSVRWETMGSEFRYERPGSNGTIVFVSGHGNPAILDNGTVRRKIGHLAMTTLVPHLPVIPLSNSLANPAVEVSAPQQVSLGGSVSALKISFIDHTDELSSVICRQDWYIDPNTFLPLRVDFLASEINNALNTAKMTYLFSNYKTDSGVAVPFTITTLFEGQQVSQLDLSSVQVNAAIPATDFDVNASTVAGAQ